MHSFDSELRQTDSSCFNLGRAKSLQGQPSLKRASQIWNFSTLVGKLCSALVKVPRPRDDYDDVTLRTEFNFQLFFFSQLFVAIYLFSVWESRKHTWCLSQAPWLWCAPVPHLEAHLAVEYMLAKTKSFGFFFVQGNWKLGSGSVAALLPGTFYLKMKSGGMW